MRTKILLVLMSIALSLLMLEIGLRVYLTSFGTDSQRVLYLYNREQLNAFGQRFTGAAYVNYLPASTHEQHNALGYRGDDIQQPKPDGIYRVVALGGSTTYGEFIPQAEDAYPAQLQTLLRTEYDHEQVEVINAGVPGYTTYGTFVNFAMRVLDLNPDMVIVYHAVNDITPRLVLPEFYRGDHPGRGFWRVDDRPIPISSLYRFVMVRLGWQPPISDKIESQFVYPLDFKTCGLTFRDDEPYCSNFDMRVDAVLDANPPVYFERNLRNLLMLAQSYEIDVLLSTWAYSPLPFDVPGGDFMTEPYRQRAVEEHNAIIVELAREFEVDLIDFADIMPEDVRYWVDGLHLNTIGARLQAEAYAPFIAANQ